MTSYTTSAYVQARENHRCSHTQIMDVVEDSYLYIFLKHQSTSYDCVALFTYMW